MNEISKFLIHPGKRIRTQITVLILAWIAFVPQLRAQTILTESFNYPAGTLLIGALWTQSATGTPTISVSTGNLTIPNSIGDGMGNKVALANTGQDVYKTFTSTTLSATVPAIYTTAVVNVSAAQTTGDYFLSLGNATTSIARVYIQSNGTGFSFGVLRNTGTVAYESTVRPFNTNIKLVLKYEQVAGATNDIVKLYVNPSAGNEPGVADISHTGTAADATSFAAIQLYQGTTAATTNAPTLELDNIVVNTTWAGVTSAAYDYGDAPTSYDNTKDGVFAPAGHSILSGLYLGSIVPDLEYTPASVALDADNNGANGDGTDEDAIPIPNPIRKGITYSLSIPVNNPAAATRYLYGWIDFNNDRKFQSNEMATVVTFSTAGATIQTLTWTALQTSTIVAGSTKLYIRIRLSSLSLIDATDAAIDERSVGNGATSTASALDARNTPAGEVEDYQITVNYPLEYGDLPASFENDKDSNFLPASSAILTGFSIGKLIDEETSPASVTSPNQNNTTGDNVLGLIDEDGLSTFASVSRGAPHSITVPVNVPATLTGTKYLYGWLDLNGDGKFQIGEVATATSTVIGENYLTLTWSAAQTLSITPGTARIYSRLRLSNLNLIDFTGAAGGTTIDERSIGNGATTTANAVNNPLVSFGEIEDYQLPVDQYDFGDVPVSYDTNNASALQPARHISSINYTIGTATDFEPTAQSVAAGADNNVTNGDGADEDGITGILPVITKGTSFNFSVPVNTATASDIIAWVDFNNNGKFEASEAAYTASTGTTTGYQATVTGTSNITFWFRGAQTALIPAGVTNLYARIRLATTTGSDNATTNAIDERSIADGGNTGIYTTSLFGEVEDYRFGVSADVYDFGDAPASYEMDKDGTANPANYKPARNNPTDLFYLGKSFDKELTPNSMASGADNNGTNGDGADEDGLAPGQLLIQSADINSFTVALNNNTGSAATLYGWIDTNNNGRFEAGEAQSVSVANGATSAILNFTAAQISAIASTTNKVYMRLRLVQPDPGVTIGDLTTGTNSVVVDERAIADGLSAGAYATVSNGEVEDYQLMIIRDFGDIPSTYENGSPASQSNTIVPEVTLGATIDYELANTPVASGADNNGTNGDGADEDAISTAETITSGTPFTLKVPVNSTLSGTKNLYGWIDFNGDGIFNGNEFASITVSVTAGTTATATLTWANTTAGATVLLAGKTYARLRLSTAALAANGNSATPALIDTRSYGPSTNTGEIEDYQFLITDHYDFGDAPISYDMNKDGTVNPLNYLPARQAISPLLTIGTAIDIEASAQHVSAGANNNGTNGDGNDEDGTTAMPINKGSAYYSKVSVMNNTGTAKNLYGWIDFNNDGRFQTGESATVSVPSSATQQTVYLSWTVANTNTIAAGANNVYMRLRISNGTLADLTTGPNNAAVDEKAIGDGLAGTAYGVAQIGEIEDYFLPVTSAYDFGDAPDTYDNSRNNNIAPARQAISSALYLGNLAADQESAKLTSANALDDDNNNIDDEDGTVPSPIFTGGGNGYSLRVKATNNTAAAKTLYGWIDFNNDGRFQATEATTIPVPVATNNGLVTLTWAAANTVITGAPSQLMMRLRISEAATLTDFTTGAPGALVDERALADGLNTGEYAASPVIFNGEIEDYAIPVTNQLDYGDAPVTYDQNTSGGSLPARHLYTSDLNIGNTTDIESAPQNVAAGADNNGTNGDGADEDGITSYPLPALVSGSEYNLDVKVKNTLATAAVLHAWIDMNGDGKFSANEYSSASVPANAGETTANLYWYITNYSGTAANTYIRMRLTTATLTDNTATTNVDERSIGEGLSAATSSYPINGEVEDYRLPIDATPVVVPGCDPTDDRLGILDPVQGLFHASIIKTTKGDYLVFGNSAYGDGVTNQLTPAKVVSGSNGFNFTGTPLMVTGSSNNIVGHQYYLLTSTGLYVWGTSGMIFTNATNAMTQVALPPQVAPGNIQMIDAGRNSSVGSLMILTKTGEIWSYTNTIGHNVQGDGNIASSGWHKVTTAPGVPLTGMKDVKAMGPVAMATDGNNIYTWGTGVYLGNGSNSQNKAYATLMQTPIGITLPIKQMDLGGISTSYYLRDANGKVFVLGDNGSGKLGLGNTNETKSWLTIDYVNEEPEAAGNQADITKPIKKVIWISASNHDSGYSDTQLSLITEDNIAYACGGNDGSKVGVVGATSTSTPTAVTMSSGGTKVPGKMIIVESGGHISILIKDKNDRYGYVGHTVDGSDGCGGCTGSPAEYNFTAPPSTGPVCGNTAFDYGDLDDNYNIGDKASHQILYSQTDNPLKLGTAAADSDEGPQFTITGSGNDALGDDNDGDGSIDDEDAFTGTMPVKTAGIAYTLNIPLTNNTGNNAYLYGFVDWNNNGLFESSETVVQTVPASATAQTVTLTWADPGNIANCNAGVSIRSFIRLRLTTSTLTDVTSTTVDERSHLAAADGEVEDYYVDWTPNCAPVYCYKPAAVTGTPLETKHGITALGRAGADNSNWPMERKGAWTVLESKEKGFVINRVSTTANLSLITNPIEGMMVYDEEADCLKIYTIKEGESVANWHCFTTQACPD
ncbi:hypothetical protein SAMN05421857_3054 [Chryseobacterium formosense]|uniref:GEVED domain-containing protein n=1 Tax=Chryseobacterium formosense TaxID=236814 RepID=UPI0008E8C049|nr:GEVED domain-containing protein [Chryseobacterium formosense]SFT75512.1 hypothetical protein SAMN05421857_3054 [Chryseobacterium formosense]